MRGGQYPENSCGAYWAARGYSFILVFHMMGEGLGESCREKTSAYSRIHLPIRLSWVFT